jgi:2-C-methyl-D-erythritol 4-phosphate cytidylyltransferase/2-C-methyl-D-erythritol 2,4-cyclodiphosphate synthase
MGAKKQWLYQDNKPLWQKVADDFATAFSFEDIIIVGNKDELEYMHLFGDYTVIAGGSSRQESLQNALKSVQTKHVLVNDVARCCVDTEMVSRVIENKDRAACVVPTLGVVDTLYVEDEAADRDQARLIQTPQLSQTETLRHALSTENEYTDESSAIRALGENVLFVEGSNHAHKLTRQSDLHKLPCLTAPSSAHFTGYGIDIHPFEDGKDMKLCGITVDSPFGFKAHSDGDVAIHALIDALVGAAGLGDIGELFPDTDAAYAGADSVGLLEKVTTIIGNIGFDINNVDMTILAQVPKILPYKQSMREKIAGLLSLPLNRVNIKATTAEKLGFVGRKEGVTVHAVASLSYFDWTKDNK